MVDKPIAIACDHGGFELKGMLIKDLQTMGKSVLDLGTGSDAAVDYPDFGYAMAKTIAAGDADQGILICGTGIGISIAANRHPAVRAAVVHDGSSARLARQHNDANVLCLGGRLIGTEVARDAMKIFLETPFEGGGRHERRVGKLSVPTF